jgi:hypothetical protein
MKIRAVIWAIVIVGCGNGEDESSEPGLETGPCLSGRQCAAGLVCASDLCVDLDDEDEGGTGSLPKQDNTPMSSGSSPSSDHDAADSVDDGVDDAMDDANASADAGDDPTAPTDPTDHGAEWCPVPPAALDCTVACDLFQYECYECPHEPGDICTYYEHQYEQCVTGCESTKATPGDFVYEVFACRQFAGTDCGDAQVECLLDIDCSAI